MSGLGLVGVGVVWTEFGGGGACSGRGGRGGNFGRWGVRLGKMNLGMDGYRYGYGFGFGKMGLDLDLV